MNETDIRINDSLHIPASELSFRTSRSGGPGGQNVNKVSSKVELLFDVKHSAFLSANERQKILNRLGKRIDSAGVLHLVSQSSRSQLENKEHVVSEFARIVRAALKPTKKRIPTHPTKAAKEKRLKRKKMVAEKKKMRNARIPE